MESPTAIPLPTSPEGTQSEFAALIDLLATDEPIDALNFTLKPDVQDTHRNLRDEDGRLDFVKIRSLFSSTGNRPRSPSVIPSNDIEDQSGLRHAINYREITEDTARIGKNSSYEPHSSGGNGISGMSPPLPTNRMSSTAPLSSPRPPMGTDSQTFGAYLVNAVAESTPLAIIPTSQDEDLNLIDLTSDGPPWIPTSAKREELHSIVDSSRRVVHQHFKGDTSQPQGKPSLFALKNALDLAQQEVVDLRHKCHELEKLVRISPTQSSPLHEKREPEEAGRVTPLRQSPPTQDGRDQMSLQGDIIEAGVLHTRLPGNVDNALDVDALSPSQTRVALISLLKKLSLPSSCILNILAKEDLEPRTGSISSLEEIHRALDVVIFVDELVWKRSRFGAPHDNPYCEENIQALRERLELWERAVRTRR